MASLGLRGVGARLVPQPPLEHEGGAGRAAHRHRLRQVRPVGALPELVAAGDDAGGAVLGRELVEHPHDVGHEGIRRPGRGDEALVGVQEHGLAAGAGDVGVDVREQEVGAEHVAHELEDQPLLGQLLEDPAFVEERPHPLIGAVLVDVIGAVGDLGRCLLGQPRPHGVQRVRRQRTLDEAVAVFVEVGGGLLQISGEHCCHRADRTAPPNLSGRARRDTRRDGPGRDGVGGPAGLRGRRGRHRLALAPARRRELPEPARQVARP